MKNDDDIDWDFWLSDEPIKKETKLNKEINNDIDWNFWLSDNFIEKNIWDTSDELPFEY